MPRLRKKPVEVDAIQWTGNNFDEVRLFCPEVFTKEEDSGTSFIVIPTLEGDHYASAGDWIIKGVKGEHYPIKDDICKETYEFVSD